jgi:hypothetical protein
MFSLGHLNSENALSAQPGGLLLEIDAFTLATIK